MIGGKVLRDQTSLMNLGDLAILIQLCKTYESMNETQKRIFYDAYKMTEREIQMLLSKKTELEK